MIQCKFLSLSTIGILAIITAIGVNGYLLRSTQTKAPVASELVNYTVGEFGLSFTYPINWGQVQVEQSDPNIGGCGQEIWFEEQRFMGSCISSFEDLLTFNRNQGFAAPPFDLNLWARDKAKLNLPNGTDCLEEEDGRNSCTVGILISGLKYLLTYDQTDVSKHYILYHDRFRFDFDFDIYGAILFKEPTLRENTGDIYRQVRTKGLESDISSQVTAFDEFVASLKFNR